MELEKDLPLQVKGAEPLGQQGSASNSQCIYDCGLTQWGGRAVVHTGVRTLAHTGYQPFPSPLWECCISS